MTADVIAFPSPAPNVIACGGCDGVDFNLFDDRSVICAECGAPALGVAAVLSTEDDV